MLYQDYDDDDDEILGIEMTSSTQPLNTIHRKMSNIKNNYPTNRYVKHVQYWKLIRKILLGIVVLGILISYVLSDYTITEKVLEEDHDEEDSFIQDYDSDNTKKEQVIEDDHDDDDDDDEAVLDNDTTNNKDWLKNKQKVTNEEWLKKKVSIEDGKQFEIVDSFVHDTDAFLEGLCYNPKDGYLYESVGLTGKSDIRKIDLNQNGTIIEKVIMEDPYFGEGLTLVDDKLIQLTYKKKVGFVYTIEPFELVSNFTYDTGTGEGWGLTYNPNKKELILNDGGDYLIFWDASTYQEKRRVKVKRQSGKPARQINELEYWKDRIVANVWFEDTILIIHPETGECEKEYDLSSLAYDISKKRGHGACLNGISISSDPDLLYISGKLWDTIFLIRLL